MHQRIAVRTTVTLDDEAYEAALTLAKTSGERLGAVISTLIRRALQTSDISTASEGNRFPTFQVPPQGAMISLRGLRRAWEEE
ncbi:hypothetical protein BH20VER3_BH20VER3_22910 [soil metagenome]